MGNKLSPGAAILVVVGLVILGITIILTKNDPESISTGDKASRTEPFPAKASRMRPARPALPITKMRVRQVYPSLGFVTLEGLDKLGVTKGSALGVVRDGVVVAKIRVTTVEGRMAAADILPDSGADGESVRAGDALVPSRFVAVQPDARVRAADRIAKGTIAQGGINPTWGFVVVDRIQGSPQRGDEAYLQRLGPAGGLMTIESVERSKLFLNATATMLGELKPGDRIETRPTSLVEDGGGPKR